MQVSEEYARKVQVASRLADAAYIKAGITGMSDELAFLRRSDADSVVIATFDRLYHSMVLRS